jgi:hypothetical protein
MPARPIDSWRRFASTWEKPDSRRGAADVGDTGSEEALDEERGEGFLFMN